MFCSCMHNAGRTSGLMEFFLCALIRTLNSTLPIGLISDGDIVYSCLLYDGITKGFVYRVPILSQYGAVIIHSLCEDDQNRVFLPLSHGDVTMAR